MQGGTSTTLEILADSSEGSSQMTFRASQAALYWVIDGTGLVTVQMTLSAGVADQADGEKG